MEPPTSELNAAQVGPPESSAVRTFKSQSPWLLLGSVGWVVATGIAWLSAWFSAFTIFLLPKLSEKPGVRIDAELIFSDAKLVSILTLFCMPFALAVLVVAVRLRGWKLREYFALQPFGVTHLLVGIMATAGTLLAATGIGALLGEVVEPDFMDDMMASLRQRDAVWLMASSAIFVAPIGEELIFRGFLFKGVSASRLGAVGAIVLCAAFWALAHIQFNMFFVFVVFALGLVLGALRAWSGSTLLTIVLHMMINLVGFASAFRPMEAA